MPSKVDKELRKAEIDFIIAVRRDEVLNRCMDCLRKWDPDKRFHWHHRDPATKSFGIGSIHLSISDFALEEELAKCDLLCASCHRKRHWGEDLKVKDAPQRDIERFPHLAVIERPKHRRTRPSHQKRDSKGKFYIPAHIRQATGGSVPIL